jgi:hypothetical protein
MHTIETLASNSERRRRDSLFYLTDHVASRMFPDLIQLCQIHSSARNPADSDDARYNRVRIRVFITADFVVEVESLSWW